ncbi:MAG: response regulator [Sedimentisphaerales bacterium]|nr:response regulator [Sedimentisphaerales bacterium]
MNPSDEQRAHRLLVIDDNPSIHKDFESILLDEDDRSTLNSLRSEMFGNGASTSVMTSVYQLDFASQGKEGCEKAKIARSEGHPYEVMFVDMRMPPGWDGLQTIEQIWEIDPDIQAVICTAYSDYSWGEITERLGRSDKLLILKKPFDSAEVAQLASALTEKWHLTQQAALKTEELEQRVEERTNALTQANERLKEEIVEREEAQRQQAELLGTVENMNKELKDFASIVSHDLKAPLRGIKALATWIMDDCSDKLGEEANEQLNMLVNRVDKMYELVDGVLRYSRAGRTEENPLQIDLNKYIPDIIDMLAPPENIQITFESTMPVIECEQTRILQLFQNLLGNAIKYNDKPKGQIKIDCVEEGDFWKFSIADNGPGIEEKHFERIFKMFQILTVTDKPEGTGVGLTIAKKITEMCGGTIWVESQLGKGSTFFFTLPKKKTRINHAKLKANTTR